MKPQFADIKSFLPAVRMQTLFDVGANIGQSTRALRQEYPKARIFSFEPTLASFDILQASRKGDAATQCYRLALGDRPGRVAMEQSGTRPTNRIVTAAAEKTVEVEVNTGDAFCAAHGIDHIDFLKIDTEGHDLKVCAGFSGMIAAKQIELIQVEAGMNPDNRDHVPMQEFVQFFQPFGYLIFRIYDQDMRPARPRLRRANIVFVSPSQLAAARSKPTAIPELTRL